MQGVAEEFLRAAPGKLRSVTQYEKDIAAPGSARMGQLQISSVKRRDVSRLLDKVEDGSGPPTAQLTLAVVRRLFSWHAARSDDFNQSNRPGMSRVKESERRRKRILNDDELVRVWKAAEEDKSAFGPYIQFLLLTGCRRNEAAAMTWSEVNGSLWTCRAERNKTKQVLVRPLSRAALAAMAKAPRYRTAVDHMFSSTGGMFNAAHRKPAFKTTRTTGWTLHDLRRTARSLMSRAGVSTSMPNVASAICNRD